MTKSLLNSPIHSPAECDSQEAWIYLVPFITNAPTKQSFSAGTKMNEMLF